MSAGTGVDHEAAGPRQLFADEVTGRALERDRDAEGFRGAQWPLDRRRTNDATTRETSLLARRRGIERQAIRTLGVARTISAPVRRRWRLDHDPATTRRRTTPVQPQLDHARAPEVDPK